jgi:hypothetical protein
MERAVTLLGPGRSAVDFLVSILQLGFTWYWILVSGVIFQSCVSGVLAEGISKSLQVQYYAGSISRSVSYSRAV